MDYMLLEEDSSFQRQAQLLKKPWRGLGRNKFYLLTYLVLIVATVYQCVFTQGFEFKYIW